MTGIKKLFSLGMIDKAAARKIDVEAESIVVGGQEYSN